MTNQNKILQQQTKKHLATAFMLFLSSLFAKSQPLKKEISEDFPFDIKHITVDGIELAYYEQGAGDVVLFLHGIPTSSYLWRNVVPLVSTTSRAIALDLAGFGQSDLPNNGYSFQSQYEYLKRFINQLALKNIVLVVNDLGSALGIRYAIENETNVKALVLIEAAFMPAPLWYKQLTTMQKMTFTMFGNHPKLAEKMIVTKNKMPSMALKMGTHRKLSEKEMEFYLKPYHNNPERRRVYLSGPGPATFPKKGITQQSGDFADVLNQNAKGLLTFSKPMLLLHARPGFIVQKEAIEYAKENFQRCLLVDIGKGKHFLPEENPIKIGLEINSFIRQLK